ERSTPLAARYARSAGASTTMACRSAMSNTGRKSSMSTAARAYPSRPPGSTSYNPHVPLTCASCGRDNPDDARFCAACGASLGEVAPAGRKERKFATALFADLVGSTSLAEREDPEVVQSLVSRTFDRMA